MERVPADVPGHDAAASRFAGQPAGRVRATVAIDDTLFRRRGKVRAASWFHDGSAPGPAKTGYGNNMTRAGPRLRAVITACSKSAVSEALPVLG